MNHFNRHKNKIPNRNHLEETFTKVNEKKHYLSAGSLLWIGLGGIIGAGFFLASGLPIRYAGPSVVFAYLLGGILTAHIAGALTSLLVSHPVEGSFKVYAEEFMGPFMGYFVGWTFWIASILAIGSETIAMAIFSQLWFPNVPQWMLTLIYSVIVIILNAVGLKNFGKVESVMSFTKVLALVLFIVMGAAALLGFFSTTQTVGIHTFLGSGGWFPNGFSGFIQSMLIVIFAFAGIAVIAMASSETRNPRKDIPRAMLWLNGLLITLYVISIFVVLCLVPWDSVSTKASPFVMALHVVNIPLTASIMNFIILISAFSVMVGTFYAAIIMLVTLGHARQAPSFVTKKSEKGVYINSLLITSASLGVIILTSFMLPSKIYDYLISASAYFAFLTLIAILLCFLLWLRKEKKAHHDSIYISKLAFGAPWVTILTLGIIVFLLLYSLTIPDQRRGFYFALGFSLVVSLCYWFVSKKHRASE